MKSLEQILKQEPVFLHIWGNKIDMIADFEGINMDSKEYYAEEAPYPNVEYWLEKKEKLTRKIKEYERVNVLFASYGDANYSGDAFVLFEKDGRLYEVNGSHCSCYGLEGQFESEETSLEYLEKVLKRGTFGTNSYSGNEFKNELCEFLGVEE